MEYNFIHLKAHSEYSIRDGLLHIKPWLKVVADMQMPAVALTDFHNLFALIKFYKHALALGVKPIIGADVNIIFEPAQNTHQSKSKKKEVQDLVHGKIKKEDRSPSVSTSIYQTDQQPADSFPVTLLCQNQLGYQNLTALLSKAYIEGQGADGEPLIHWSWLEEMNQGLIVLSGGLRGDIGQALLQEQSFLVDAKVQCWLSVFGDRFYLEIERIGRNQEEDYIERVVNLSLRYQIPVVATNDVRFLSTEDYEAHEARVCIHAGYILQDTKRPHLYTRQQYLRSPAEMYELFKDIPEALENTVAVARRCNVILELGKVSLPNFPVPNQEPLEFFLEKEAQSGLQERLLQALEFAKNSESSLNKTASTCSVPDQDLDSAKLATYQQRLQMELGVINRMGFAGYFLIVADFIRWAKQNQIPVGPGRGSGAGSLVAYCLGITALDPLEHELLFERFLNPERVSMPDFDIDFCMEKRDLVIDYVANRYGREAVAQIITYGTMAAKAVVRDVGRVLAMPYGFVDKIAKLIPFEVGITLEKALASEEKLAQRYEEEEDVATLINLAKKLEGIIRNAGKHAGGVVIAPTRLIDFAPLFCEPGGEHIVTQFDKDDVEAVGLVKFDFLGLGTLTIIDWTLKAVNQSRLARNEIVLDIEKIPLNDKKTFELLKRCETTAVFQLESRGMKELIRRLQPDIFEEITALVALFRPGPLQSGMVDDFIARKHGRALAHYPHPKLEPILRPTYGVILYQEQVMQIAQTLSGYSLGQADLLRRAMGKKKPEEMAKQRHSFVSGAKSLGVEESLAENIFDLIEKFAGYGFNKSHSAAYALIAYQTAWLKAHYPAEFMAAVLSSDMDNTDKVVSRIRECDRMKVVVLPPNLNKGKYHFLVNQDGKIEYGLGAIKGVGEAAIELIVIERDSNKGVYSNLFDFCKRLDNRKVSRRIVEPLIKSGAMDVFNCSRSCIFASIDKAFKVAEQFQRNRSSKQLDLFSTLSSDTSIEYEKASNWSEAERLQGEKETLGHYISGHPLQAFQKELSELASNSIIQLNQMVKKTVTIAGVLQSLRIMQTKRGQQMAIAVIADCTGEIEVTLFAKIFEPCREFLHKEQIYIINGVVDDDQYTGGVKIVGESVEALSQIRRKRGKRLVLMAITEKQKDFIICELAALLEPYRGGQCVVVIKYQTENTSAEIIFTEKWQVKPSPELLTALWVGLDEQGAFLDY